LVDDVKNWDMQGVRFSKGVWWCVPSDENVI